MTNLNLATTENEIRDAIKFLEAKLVVVKRNRKDDLLKEGAERFTHKTHCLSMCSNGSSEWDDDIVIFHNNTEEIPTSLHWRSDEDMDALERLENLSTNRAILMVW